MTLINANSGDAVAVVRLEAVGLQRRRLMDLGFVPGTRVEILRRSPLGDPTAYRVRGATIALRAIDAVHVVVEAI